MGEPLTPDNFIEEFELEAEEAAAEYPDYTPQLEFHEYELAHAEERQFPEGQKRYHIGRVALLKRLMYEQT